MSENVDIKAGVLEVTGECDAHHIQKGVPKVPKPTL